MPGALVSAIYRGSVMHRRLRPKAHYLRYRMFYLLLDLDELPRLGGLRLLGVERRAIMSFRARDHGDGSGDLKAWVGGQLARAGLHFAPGRVRLLTLPRVFGFVFNPISVYFCHDLAGELRATIYEVNNTFGGRHAYVLPASAHDRVVRQQCAKALFVSPFNDMSGGYRFSLLPPGDRVALGIDQYDEGGSLLRAAFAGQRVILSDAALLKLLVIYPLLTIQVIAGIHWEALKLWWKGVPLQLEKRPRNPDTAPGETAQPVAARLAALGGENARTR
ncbi:hypothetical protein A8950_3717 [Dongia mobilis]|uniref:DUF1365 family protein n=1 Tax=Dongia mobilis TaxID=578943 RepID=A0A4R6WH17_9PROT|nr:DUF1365 domain-containing protein [Dongia mobilis]TDQ77565.1 hypothetical protein A8950_3717 [Dongia mobilis]